MTFWRGKGTTLREGAPQKGGRTLEAADGGRPEGHGGPRALPNGAKLPYGIGWFVQEYRGETLLWHSGVWEEAYSAIYLKVPRRHLTIILLANIDGLRWNNPLDGAEVERSPFVAAFLGAFPQ